MTRPAVVLRPEPGNRETAARLEALGLRVLRLPLFAVAPIAWHPPALDDVDAILLTSANAIRHGGAGLDGLKHLPVVAVGEATARAARAAGFTVTLTGESDAATAATTASERYKRMIHLGGRDRSAVPNAMDVAVYASDPLEISSDVIETLAGSVALLHSARAARRFATLAGAERSSIRVAALSPAVAAAAGSGWEKLIAADAPTDSLLVALAATLVH